MDTVEQKLKVAKEPVCHAHVAGTALEIAWEGPWAAWGDLTNSQEVADLKDRANGVPQRASAKGGGKGKKGGH